MSGDGDMSHKKRVAIYTRMSKEDGDSEKNLGLARQLRYCRQLAKEYGWHVVGVFSDEASGFDQNVERPDFDRLTELVKKRSVDVVLAYAIDRISRRVRVTAAFADTLSDHGVDLVTYRERETSGVYLHILAALAQSESDVMSRRLRDKFTADFHAGGKEGPIPKLGGQRPYGYEQAPPDENGKLCAPWYVQVEHEAKMVKKMAQHVIKMGPRPKGRGKHDPGKHRADQLLTYLQAHEAKTPKGNDWTWQAVCNKLLSPTIAGYMSHYDDKKNLHLIRKAAWKPIITEKQWSQLNEIFGREIVQHDTDNDEILRIDPGRVPRRQMNRVGALTGLLYTSKGNPMHASTTSQGYEIYVSDASNDYTSIQREPLEEWVLSKIGDEASTLSDPHDSLFEGLTPKERTRADIEAELAIVRKELSEYVGMMSGRSKPIPMIEDAIQETVDKAERLESELAISEHPFLSRVPLDPRGNAVDAEMLALFPHLKTKNSFKPWLAQADLHQKRALLSQWIERIEVAPDQEGIRRLKEERGIDPDDKSPEAVRAWRSVADKTKEKARLRTTITLRRKGWPKSMTEEQYRALERGGKGPEDFGLYVPQTHLDEEPGAAA